MPYKIVQTIERGRPVLTAVPHEWENDGILCWPKKTEVNKLRRIEHSRPEENWDRLNCILKRSKIPSYTKAESEIDKMSNFSDTETDNDNYRNTSYIKDPAKSHKISTQRTYNEMARDVKDSQTREPFNLHSEEIPTSFQQHTVTENHENVVDIVENYNLISEESNLMSNMVLFGNDAESSSAQNTVTINNNIIDSDQALTIILQKVGSVQEDLKTLVNDVKTINKNQQTIFQNQQNMITKVIELQIQLDEIVKQSSIAKTTDPKTVDYKPISNADELQELESLLRDPDFKSRMITKLEIICSKGKNRVATNAYALIDVLFKRKFLIDCSWGGGSKTEQSKIGLRSYKNVFNLFLSVLNNSDPDFKKPDCEKFFKTIIKNARQRFASKQTRLSTTRIRVKTKNDAASVSDQTINDAASVSDQTKNV